MFSQGVRYRYYHRPGTSIFTTASGQSHATGMCLKKERRSPVRREPEAPGGKVYIRRDLSATIDYILVSKLVPMYLRRALLDSLSRQYTPKRCQTHIYDSSI